MNIEKDSDVEDLDFGNFKGIYEGEQKEKYYDPDNGAHFEYYDLCKRMAKLKELRKQIDMQLGITPDFYEDKPQNNTKAEQVKVES